MRKEPSERITQNSPNTHMGSGTVSVPTTQTGKTRKSWIGYTTHESLDSAVENAASCLSTAPGPSNKSQRQELKGSNCFQVT